MELPERLCVHKLLTDEIHKDSTTITFIGNYKNPDPDAVKLRHGHNKDFRPDCKQLVFGLNITSDGHVPLSYKLFDGNTNDDVTHIPNWNGLRTLLEKEDFIYVADCKLCSRKNLNHIAQNGGFSRLQRTADEIKLQNALSRVVFGLEPTGNYHKPLAGHLIRCGSNVVLVSGEAVKKNRSLLDGRWDKHDTKCAANIADLVSRGRCLYYDSPLSGIIELRSLLSLRRRLKREEHSLWMRIRNNLLALYFPELDSARYCFARMFIIRFVKSDTCL